MAPNIIFNYYFHNLSKSDKHLLCKGLNFAIPPDKLEQSDYLLPFELPYCDIKDLDLLNEKTNFLKAKIKDCALSSIKLYNDKCAASSLNNDEILTLKTLSKNNYLVIIGIEKKLTNLRKELKASETISEIDYKKLKPRGSNLVFYMAWANS